MNDLREYTPYNQEQGLEGLSYFERIDSRYITIDTGPRNQTGSKTVHFDPGSGILHFRETVANPDFPVRQGMSFNLRTHRYISDSDDRCDPGSDPRLATSLQLLGKPYVDWLEHPPGFSETKALIARIAKTQRISLDEIEKSFQRGDYILFFDYKSELHACKVDEVVPITDTPMAEGKGYSVHTDFPSTSIIFDLTNYRAKQVVHDEPCLVAVGSIFPFIPTSPRPALYRGVWTISQEEYDELMKYTESPADQSIAEPLSRGEYVVAKVLEGIAFERWGADTEEVRQGNPDHYSKVTKENLKEAISRLVTRFKRDKFVNALNFEAYLQLSGLHTPQHRSKDVLSGKSDYNDVHSDIDGFDREITRLAVEAIDGVHPIPDIKSIECIGPVGEGVYNSKPLFGDLELLTILKENYPDIFSKFISYLSQLGAIRQDIAYGYSTVYPMNAIKDFFPEAFAYIQANYQGQISLTDKPGIVYG